MLIPDLHLVGLRSRTVKKLVPVTPLARTRCCVPVDVKSGLGGPLLSAGRALWADLTACKVFV
jgi:hypothetical protein